MSEVLHRLEHAISGILTNPNGTDSKTTGDNIHPPPAVNYARVFEKLNDLILMMSDPSETDHAHRAAVTAAKRIAGQYVELLGKLPEMKM